jgi:diadenosine tetraphosphate (Ap4A) HIT family hydrolase
MTNAIFELHPRLAADTAPVADLDLCRVLLMDDARFPWLILVPRRRDLVEIVDLDAPERRQLMDEVAAASRALRAVAPCDKLNIGALGNLVPQLHVHVVSRVEGDPAWPGPVWGSGGARPYDAAWRDSMIEAVRREIA